MKNSRFTLLMMLCWVFLLTPILASAQVGGPVDTDGDGIPDSSDLCPTRPGPTVSMGCPDTDGDGLLDNVDLCPDDFGTVQSGGCPDSDGDGTPDNLDACPTQGGPDFNRGCPTDQPAENPVPENRTNPVRPVVGGDCTVATFLSTAVNIREYASPDAPVVGTLDPSVLYNAYGMMMVDGNPWYFIEGGWVSGVAVVLGGDCGGMSQVSYFPDYGRVPAADATEAAFRLCIKMLDRDWCIGKGPIIINNNPGGSTEGWNKVCKGIKGKIVCFLVEEIIFAVWDWWNEDDGAAFDPTSNPDILIFDDPGPSPEETSKKICKGIKGKIICFLVEEIISAVWDWWNSDSTETSDGLIYDPFRPTIFVPPAPPTSTGDARPSQPDLPFCHDLLNDVIAQHVPADGSSPVQTVQRGNYLVLELIFIPEIPLPQQQPCIKWVDAAMEYKLTDVLVSGYQVEYASWPPNGWLPDLTNSTVPLYAFLLDETDQTEASPRGTALIIDFLGNSTVDESGHAFFGFGIENVLAPWWFIPPTQP